MSGPTIFGSVFAYFCFGAIIALTALENARLLNWLVDMPTRARTALLLIYAVAWPLVAPLVVGSGLVYVARGVGDLYRMWRPEPELPVATARKVSK